MYDIGPGWHGSNWMGYGHRHPTLSCHETRKEEEAPERAHRGVKRVMTDDDALHSVNDDGNIKKCCTSSTNKHGEIWA